MPKEQTTKCEPSSSGRRCSTHNYLPLYPDGLCSVGRICQMSSHLAAIRHAQVDLTEAYRASQDDGTKRDALESCIRAKLKIDNAIHLLQDDIEKLKL
jgi:hypothetical protein